MATRVQDTINKLSIKDSVIVTIKIQAYHWILCNGAQISLFIYLFIHLCVIMFIYFSIYVFIYLFVYLSIIILFDYLFIYLYIYFYVYSAICRNYHYHS